MGLLRKMWLKILGMFNRASEPEKPKQLMLPMLVRADTLDPDYSEPIREEVFAKTPYLEEAKEEPETVPVIRDPRAEMPTYWKLRDRMDADEKKLYKLLRRAKHARNKKIEKRYISIAKRQNKRLQRLYRQIKKIELEAKRDGREIKNPVFS